MKTNNWTANVMRRDIRLIERDPCSGRIHWRVVDHGPERYWQRIAVVDGRHGRAYLERTGWARDDRPQWEQYNIDRAYIWPANHITNSVAPRNIWPGVPIESLRRAGIRIAGVTVNQLTQKTKI